MVQYKNWSNFDVHFFQGTNQIRMGDVTANVHLCWKWSFRNEGEGQYLRQ